MNFNEYQDLATRTAKFSDFSDNGVDVKGLAYCGLGLNGEAGEVAELVKKLIRDDKGDLSEERRQKIKAELGDVLWYLSQTARLSGFTLDEIAQHNIDKLWSRHERGKIHGSGDDR